MHKKWVWQKEPGSFMWCFSFDWSCPVAVLTYGLCLFWAQQTQHLILRTCIPDSTCQNCIHNINTLYQTTCILHAHSKFQHTKISKDEHNSYINKHVFPNILDSRSTSKDRVQFTHQNNSIAVEPEPAWAKFGDVVLECLLAFEKNPGWLLSDLFDFALDFIRLYKPAPCLCPPSYHLRVGPLLHAMTR